MTKEEKALIYFKDLREIKVKDYSSVFDIAPKGTVAYEAVSAEIEIYDTAIKALEQEPKTGYWIKYGAPRCGEQHYKCTLCEYYINFGQWGELYTKEFKYCPNCGAKMQESEE